MSSICAFFLGWGGFRYLLGWTMPIRFQLLKLLMSSVSNDALKIDFVCQDFAFNVKDVKGVIDRIDQDMRIYPIWLCPFVSNTIGEFHDGYPVKDDEIFVDIGIYGSVYGFVSCFHHFKP